MRVTISKEKSAIKSIGAFFTGFKAPFTALSFTGNKKGYFKFFILPFLLNCALWIFLIWTFLNVLSPWLMSFLPQDDVWYLNVLRWIIQPILVIISYFVAIFLYSITGNIVCAPFNDALSEKAERDILGEDPCEDLPILKVIMLTLQNILKQLFFTIFWSLLILFLNLIPVFGTLLYMVFSFLIVNYFFGYQFMLFPLERRKLEYADISKITRTYKWFIIGSGFAFSLLSFIPIIGFLNIPLGVLGTTIAFDEEILPELTIESIE